MRGGGLHHVPAITADIDANLRFYGKLLGLRLVWQGVTADDPGAGMVHRLLLRVGSDEALDFWERRFARAGVPSERLADRLGFSDPDGLALELVIDDGDDDPLVADAPDVDEQVAIRGMHALQAYSDDPGRSAPVLGDVLGMTSQGGARWLARSERRHGEVAYDAAPVERGIMGAGTVHHVAFTICDGDQEAWRSHIAAAGLRPTTVLDR